MPISLKSTQDKGIRQLVFRDIVVAILCGNSKPISLKPTQVKGTRQLVFAVPVVTTLSFQSIRNFLSHRNLDVGVCCLIIGFAL
jgi:hypothetical protein